MILKIKNWEQWPFQVIYAPIAPVWLWYMIRSKAVWFFTPSNPKLTFGGMEGEPKKEMHELIPPHLLPKYFNVQAQEDFKKIANKIIEVGFHYPIIVKPEIGGQGVLFRKLDNENQLKDYHEKVPVDYFIQEYISYPIEASLFYCRYPNQQKGMITGFIQKIPLHVIGDGNKSLVELIRSHPKAKKFWKNLSVKNEGNLEKIIPSGEKYILSYAANHNRGAQFVNLTNEVNEGMVNMLDKISIGINDFFYGRYDIMCQSLEDLKQGKNYFILEFNGCGAEPNHFYDNQFTIVQAWNEILKHWKILFKISRYNYSHGIDYWPFWKGFHFLRKAKKDFKKLKQIDKMIA